MTRTEAQIRNRKVFRLRGMLPGIGSLIPDDVKEKIPTGRLFIFESVAQEIIDILDELKRSRCKHKPQYIEDGHCYICGQKMDEL